MKKIIFINLLLAFVLNAQTLTLQQSIEKTLIHHPDVKAFALKVKQSLRVEIGMQRIVMEMA